MNKKELYLDEETRIDYSQTYEVITYRDSLGRIHMYESQGEDEYANFLKGMDELISHSIVEKK